MQPGLRRLLPGAPQLTPLAPGSALWDEKKAVLAAGTSRHCRAGFDVRYRIHSRRTSTGALRGLVPL